MNTTEIKALIEKGIKGQGTNIDGGGVLAEILNALADGVGNIPKIPNVGLLTERRTEISAELYEAIGRTPLIIANNTLMVISDNRDAIDNEASDDSLYTGIYTFVRSVQFPDYASDPTIVKGCTFCRYEDPDTGDQKYVVFLLSE